MFLLYNIFISAYVIFDSIRKMNNTTSAIVIIDMAYSCQSFHLVRSKEKWNKGNKNETVEVANYTIKFQKQQKLKKAVKYSLKGYRSNYYYSFKLKTKKGTYVYSGAFIYYNGKWINDTEFLNMKK